MSIDFEERLRADMGQVQVRPRPGLAREAHRRYQQSRRRGTLALAATGTAAAVAGVTAGFALTTGNPGTAPIQTTAYVVNRVSGALASTDAIGYSASHMSGDVPAAIAPPTDTWLFGARFRQLTDTPAGRPVYEVLSRPKGRSSVLTQINFQNRTWTTVTLRPGQQLTPAEGNNLCTGSAVGLFDAGSKSAADWRQIIETGLKCGAFTVAGHQRVDGVDAIKLTGHKTVPYSTIWVNPASYLPVRLVSHLRFVQAGSGPARKTGSLTLTIDFRWLPPTKANLAKLTVPIPPGFHQVKYPK